jgi:hypothetical protein
MANSKARERNWSKARLSGLTFNMSSLTQEELSIVKQIQELRKTLLENWDKNTEEHLGIKLKPLQCEWCSKRFNGEPLEEGEKYYCNKCLKL